MPVAKQTIQVYTSFCVRMSTTHPQVRDTEWDALQRKFGNLPKLPPVVTEEQLTREVVDAAEQVDTLALKSIEELNELEDDVEESVLSRYRQQRVAQLRQKQRLERFEDVYHLSKDDFVDQVTRASAVDPLAPVGTSAQAESDSEDDEPRASTLSSGSKTPEERRPNRRGTWVVVHLFKDGVPACMGLNAILPEMAKRHREVKFVKGVGSDIIPNYPDSKLPTLLLYHGGTCQVQLAGQQRELGERPTVHGFEKFLGKYGVLKPGDEEDSSEEECESAGRAGHLRISYDSRARRWQKQRKNEEESDEDREKAQTRGYSSLPFDDKIQRGY
ncbi:hypothetical protein CSUI_008053 [Cystoisospora suis]|uniref:Phosducin domain-containing protein n=1 Tax=Cystoisospora suis TaxID=483139 RepID=A0A2C6KBB1_9APIC|nr:hypothetical protein CSUI_008053 [Cystoisospora suis]